MKIWILNHYALPSDSAGGTRHFDLARQLVKRGHNVTIFASSVDYITRQHNRLGANETYRSEMVDGVRFIWLRTPPYQRNDWRRVQNMVAFALRAWRLGRRLPKLVSDMGKPDVVIGSSPHLLTPLAAYWVARHFRVPFVMEVRDIWPQTIIDMGELSAHHPITKALQVLERSLYRRSERIITLLPLAHEYITACGIPQEKIVWIPNGVDLARFQVDSSPARSDEKFKVMYLGAHGQANALDVLLQAAKIVQDQGHEEIRVIFVGDGPEKPRLIALAKELGLRNVEFREPVPKREITKILQEADIFLFNLENVEVFKYGISSNKLFDFMAAGRPVISSVKALANPVELASCGLTVPPRDPQALADAVIKLSQTPKEEREAMGRRGREYVEKYHAIPALAEKLIRCLTGT